MAEKLPVIVRLRALQRLILSVAAACVAFFVLPATLGHRSRLLVTWNVGAWVYLILAGMTVARADAAMTRARTQAYDQSGYVIFILVVASAAASFVAIGFLIGDIKGLSMWARARHLMLSVLALISSWLLIHTVFAFHYARRYYASRRRQGNSEKGGLSFPGEREPDYLDFMYYSFVVGMTSQVSDVTTASRSMRTLTLIHAILSFIFNIAILAMSINIIASVI
ncbi:MAG TPA: DUF1345 domain-containing protein [Burkholderiales bacterium]|nr:DUF1345 domain-containing protein [Burkholderiales bacterium]